MPPPVLPPHLSYKSALVLIPPTAISDPIQRIRRTHDRQFHRWPPHINLIYPFIANPTSDFEESSDATPLGLRKDIRQRVQSVAKDIKPFEMVLSSSAKSFSHSRRSSTVWLQPLELLAEEADVKDIRTRAQGACSLQTALQAEFKECDADNREFTPHLSVGQARSSTEVEVLTGIVKDVFNDFVDTSPQFAEIYKPQGLRWLVDRVFIIERRGFNEPFHVLAEVELG